MRQNTSADDGEVAVDRQQAIDCDAGATGNQNIVVDDGARRDGSGSAAKRRDGGTPRV